MKIQEDNVVEKEILQIKIGETLQRVTDIIKKSYGPYGSHTLISNKGNVPIFTKDGFSILEKIRFSEIIPANIYILLVQLSQKLVREVGDGSTSAIVTANSIYKHIADISNNFKRPKDFTDILKSIQDDVINIINEYFTISLEDMSPTKKLEILTNVASLSNNNDSDIGEQVAKIISKTNKYTSITIESAINDKDGITEIFKDGYNAKKYLAATPYIYGNNEQKTIELDSPIILAAYEIFDIHYSWITSLLQNISGKKIPLVVIYDTISQDVVDKYLEYVMSNRHNLQLYLVQTDSLSRDENLDKFNDMAVYINADPLTFSSITKDNVPNPNDVLGGCGKFVLSRKDGCSFIKGKGTLINHSERFDAHIKNIQDEYDRTSPSLKIARGSLKNRIAQLNATFCTIFVGGSTQEEKDTNKYLVEDSVLACRSVIEHGYTLGSNITPYYALSLLMSAYMFPDIKHDITFKSLKYKDNPNFGVILNKLLEAYNEVRYRDENGEGKTILHQFFSIMEKHETDIVARKAEILSNFAVYNIVTETTDNIFNSSVIASSKTDTEIIKTAFSIISLLIASNQFIS